MPPHGDDWRVLPLTEDVRLRITREMPVLPRDVEERVDRLWAAARAARPLFNGRVFCADEITPEDIKGHWTEYRRLMAQVADPSLMPILQVRSLAVCGVLVGPDGVAVGRREPDAAYQAGEWQLPPAGSVDFGAAEAGGASWRRALLGELREELGIDAAEVSALRPLCLVQHPSGVLDMGVRIDTGLSGATILERHRVCGDREYDRLFVSPAHEVEERVRAFGGVLVPSAATFLAQAGLDGVLG